MVKKQVNKFNMEPEEALIVTFDGGSQMFCQKKLEKIEEQNLSKLYCVNEKSETSYILLIKQK